MRAAFQNNLKRRPYLSKPMQKTKTYNKHLKGDTLRVATGAPELHRSMTVFGRMQTCLLTTQNGLSFKCQLNPQLLRTFKRR